MQTSSHFFKDKPLFGLDLGSSSIKVLQLDHTGKKCRVRGYGVGEYDNTSIKDGVVTDFASLAADIKDLFKHNVVGEINTRRVAISVPGSRAFTRVVSLPKLRDQEIMQAVQVEAEQYIPVPIDQLHMDYTIINRDEKSMEVLAVGIPKKIVDSYISLAHILGLEPIAIDTTILSAARLFQRQIDQNDIPTVLIDLGASSADITVHDKTIIVTGTISGGGDVFTELIAKKLELSSQEAHIVKTKYGLSKSKKQAEIKEALQPQLDNLVKEIRRMIRYHEERLGSENKIQQIITMGGGANMPGLSEYLVSAMRMPVRTCNPWQRLDLGRLQPPSEVENSIYVTAAGLALIESRELFV